MTRITGLPTLVIVLLALSPGCQTAGVDASGEFVLLRGSDTVRVERFREDGRVTNIDIAYPDGGRVDVTAWMGVVGDMDSLLFTKVDGDDRWIVRSVYSDSAILSRSIEDGEDEEVRIPTPSRVMPFYRTSLALTQLLLRRAHSAAGQTRDIALAEVGGESLRTYTLLRAGDTTLVTDPRKLLWLALDQRGEILGGRTRDGYRVIRRPLGDAVARTGSTPRPGWVAWTPPDMRRWGKCPMADHPFSPLSVTVDDSVEGAPAHLRSDGRGPYRNDIDGVGAISGPLMEIQIPRYPYLRTRPKSNRALWIDLSRPVSGSGAAPKSVGGAGFGALLAFYRKDPVTDSLFGPADMKVGEEVAAARVELVFSAGGDGTILSSLSFGTFPRGYCEGNTTVQQLAGTTPPRLKRISPTTWTVLIPRGSIGRLWSNIEGVDTTAGTHDRGLYHSSGRFEFTLLPH